MTSREPRVVGTLLVALAAGAALVVAPADAGAAACANTPCGTVSSVTYNGSALTYAGAATNGTVRTEIWYLVAPATGTHNVVVTAPVATDVTASSISFSGVNQATPLGTLVSAIGTSTTPSVVANTVLGEPVVDFVGAVGTTAPAIAGTTQTLSKTNSTSTGVNQIVLGNSTAYGQAAPVTMSWTIPSADWAIAAVPVKASTALTGVDVGSLTATWGDHGTRVAWRSGYQPSTVGFYVYRSYGQGTRTQLNQDLIPGGAIAGTLSSFSWDDATDGWNGDVSYWLKEVKQDGTSTWYGPASPVPPPAATPADVVPARDAGVDGAAGVTGFGGSSGAAGFGGGWSFGGSTGSPGSPSEVSTISRTGGCAVSSPGGTSGLAGLLLVAAAIGSARRRKRWIRPLVVLALVLGAGLWGQRSAVATGGVAIDATATATGASGLSFSHTIGAGSNRLLVVGVVTPISCTDTMTDSGNCGACGATCSLDTTSLTSGLLALWHLDEGTGTTSADASGNGNTASLVSSPAWTTGYSGNAIQGDGTSSYAQGFIGTWFGGNNTLTASAWVYTTSNTNGPVFGVTAIPSGGTWNMPFLSIQGNATNATVYGWTWQNTAISATVSLNAWHLLTLTYDPTGTSTKLYVDGAFAGSGTGAYDPSGSADYWTTYISGAKPTGVNSYLLGRVDEVRAYNRVLSAAEISALYTARLACSASTCAACGSGKTSCSGSCVVTATDNNNCGGCGIVCNTMNGETCSSGTCVCSNMALTDCSHSCVDTTTDSNNCGGCGTVCSNSTPSFIDASLLGHWPLDDGSGASAVDTSGNGRTATLTNSPTWSTGYSGTGLTFDGASNYLTSTIGTWFGGNNTLTASAWVYATAATNGPIFGVAAPPSGTGWNMPFLSINGATVYGHIWNVNGNTPLSATVTLNAWHHLAITYDPSAGETFYVDGTLSSSGTGTFVPSGVSDVWTTYIPGTKPSGVGTYLKGEIDEVRAYTRVLSASEISILAHTRQSCSGSTCGGCGGGLTACSSACTDVTIDPANCGSCGHACNTAGGETCVAGTCGCATGMDCSTICIDTTTSSTNCGACGNDCGTTTCSSCSQGLLGLWHLDEGTGTTSADTSGNSRTATLNVQTWTTGTSGGAVSFDGTTPSYLNAPLGTWYVGNNTMSAAAWVYATSTTNGPIFGVTSGPPGGDWNMPFLSIAGSTVYGWFWQVNGNTPLQATVSLNAWHFLVATYDPAAGERFYVDGALSGTGTGTFMGAPTMGATDTWTTYISGAKPAGVNSNLNGKIDEVRAYNRVLSAGEVKLLYDTHLSCTASACSGCPSGMTACSGACTNTTADKNNCNGCGTVCPGAQTCVAGTCM